MAKGRIKHSDEELQRASLAVNYEVGMLVASLDFLLGSQTTFGSSAREQMASNAMLHSFLLATRNLCPFLYSHDPWQNDIIAEDFFEKAEEWHEARPQPPPEFLDGTLVDLISKRLAHLTWHRASGTRPTWGAFRIAWELTKGLEVFASKVSSLRLDPSFAQDVKVCSLALQAFIDQHGSVELADAPTSLLWNEADLWPQDDGDEDDDSDEDEDW